MYSYVNVSDPTLHGFNMCFLNLDLDLGGTVFTKITNLLVFFPNLRLVLSSCTAVSGNVYYFLIVKFTLVDLLCMSLDVDPHSNPHGIRNRNRKTAACNVQCRNWLGSWLLLSGSKCLEYISRIRIQKNNFMIFTLVMRKGQIEIGLNFW
jgi:hypothetical protein